MDLKHLPNSPYLKKFVQGEMIVLTQNIQDKDKLKLNPPTYFRTNEMSEIQQMVVDT